MDWYGLYCVVLYCIVLCCIVLCCIVLSCVALHCVALRRVVVALVVALVDALAVVVGSCSCSCRYIALVLRAALCTSKRHRAQPRAATRDAPDATARVRQTPFIPMPMPEPLCRTYLNNKWVQYDVCQLSGQGYRYGRRAFSLLDQVARPSRQREPWPVIFI